MLTSPNDRSKLLISLNLWFHTSEGTATLIVSYARESEVIYCSRKAVDESRGDPAEVAAADVHSELLHVCLQSIPKQMSKRPLTN